MNRNRQTKHTKICAWFAVGGGAASATFCLFGLSIVMLQKVFMGLMPAEAEGAQLDQFRSMMLSLHTLWLIFMPIWIALGIGLVIFGLKMRNQARFGRHVAILCAAGLAAFVPYMWIATTDFLPQFAEGHPMMGKDAVLPFAIMQIISMLPLVIGIALFAFWAWRIGSKAQVSRSA